MLIGDVCGLHKAFLRYHDPANWPLLRETLKNMGRADLIGNAKKCLIPAFQPALAQTSDSIKPRVGKFKKPAPRHYSGK